MATYKCCTFGFTIMVSLLTAIPYDVLEVYYLSTDFFLVGTCASSCNPLGTPTVDSEKDSSHMWAVLGGLTFSERNPQEFTARGLYILNMTPRNDCPELCQVFDDDLYHDIDRMLAKWYTLNPDPIVHITVNR